jgi:APA family basic amino acid/polyamine antiporter
MVVSFYLMASLPAATWLRLIGWLIIGMFIYFLYGRKHSRVQAQTTVLAGAKTGD